MGEMLYADYDSHPIGLELNKIESGAPGEIRTRGLFLTKEAISLGLVD